MSDMIMKSMHQKYKDGEISWGEYHNYLAMNNGYKDWNEYQRKYSYETSRSQSMSENKGCPIYLGVYWAERILAEVWDNVQRMPYGNKGFDFICKMGLKIDVKSACLYLIEKKTTSYYEWYFHINKNKIADYFLLLAFNNRNDKNPLHLWLINGNEIIKTRKLNDKTTFVISNRLKSLDKYKKYELTDKLEKLIGCCNALMIKNEVFT